MSDIYRYFWLREQTTVATYPPLRLRFSSRANEKCELTSLTLNNNGCSQPFCDLRCWRSMTQSACTNGGKCEFAANLMNDRKAQ